MIAVIITIIVLLILAGVALATLTGQGNIIGNAENAVGKYNNSVAEEQQLLNEIEKHFQNYLEGGNGGSTNPEEPTEPEIIGAEEIASKPEEHYGGEVTNYLAPSGDPNVKWRIFYADESNVYLIASDYIHKNYAPESAKNTLYNNGNGYQLSFNNVIKDYNTGAANITDSRITKWINYVKDYPSATGSGIKSVAFMLDEARWSAKYAKPKYAEYAIGGPTLELWCASYKASHPDKYVECSYNAFGYQVKWSDSTSSPSYDLSGADDYKDLYYIKSNTDKCYYMWLASQSAIDSYYLMHISYNGHVETHQYADRHTGFRPVICLRSGIQLEKISNTEYRIVESLTTGHF